ncbi:MAG: sulfite exporter TauE/SafE family protein [Maricaulaceae bacterium]
MPIYLPIAEISVDGFVLIGLGLLVGFLSGLFGVGGGFLMTPLLIFIGVPPAVAVSTEASQITAASASGALGHWRRRAVDVKMGLLLLLGGALGSLAGVRIFTLLRGIGQIDVVISLCYILFLGLVGGLMAWESTLALRARKRGKTPRGRKAARTRWIDALPLKMRFPRSKLYTSALPPVLIGLTVGILAALMGVGGGFIMVPAMIYILRMPTNVVVGTSLFQIILVTALTTVLQAGANQTVDVLLAGFLILGGVLGAQLGVRAGARIRAEELRLGLALVVLGVCAKLGFDLIAPPADPFALGGEAIA